ncbi:MAG: transporter substrate-binding domain-containing protein [Deltaproteobacteria bacterium]|nr:transporter substrate-binding domain-containing protein [Deltaproteobacteria bacterium]
MVTLLRPGLALILLAALLPAPSRAEARKVRVAVFDLPPAISLTPEGAAQGFFVDLLDEAARQEGWELEYVPGGWAEGLARARAGELDLLTSVARTPEREAFLDYGEVPLLHVWSEVYTTEGQELHSVFDLRGKRVAVMRGDYNRAVFEETMRGFGIESELVEVEDFDTVFEALREGRAEAGVVNNTYGAAHGRARGVVDTGVVFHPFPIYFAVARGKNPELLRTLDRHLHAWRAEPSSLYHRRLRFWLHRDLAVEQVTPRAVWSALAGLILLGAVLALLVFVLRRRVLSGQESLVASREQLAESERMLAAIARNLPGMVYRCLARPGWRMETVSAGAATLTGHPVEALVGPGAIPFASLIHPDDLPGVEARIGEAAVAGEPFELEYRLIDRGGEEKVVWEHGTWLPASAEGENQRIGIVLDVSDRVRAESEKERLRLQLLQSQKMESIGRLAGGVAHDYNNVLGVIIGHAEMALLRETQLPGELRGYLEEIRDAALRSGELTRQLLAYARRQPSAPQVFDLEEKLQEILRFLGRLIGEDVELVWKRGDARTKVRIDPSHFDQILTNLCVNARDALEGEGTITLETTVQNLDEDDLAGETGLPPGDYARLTVSDTGSGIDETVLPMIFEPFFTTKEIGKGTGLGLATVQGIVQQNGGFIRAASRPGEGATFTVYLPAVEVELTAQARPAPLRLAEGEPATILLVEDDPRVLMTTQMMLEHLGHRVLTANGPEQALEVAELHGQELHLLLTDVVMPGMDGHALAQQLCSQLPGLRHAFLSGYTADILSRKGVLEEGVRLLHKPFSFTQFSAFLEEVLSE